jgi:hexosaminidase
VVSNPTIIPKPVKMILNEGFYNWSSNAQIISDSLFVSEKKYFQKLFSIQDVKEKNTVYFKKNNLLLKEEYFLKISENQIIIEASSPNGIMHGIQSLRQIVPINENISSKKISINCLEIHDFPRFKWRGLLLDCCRHFMQKDFVKRYIDLLAFHKMNILHWHLTEDQGWRIEIEKYPKLTEIGAWRENKDGEKYGGFYTKKDIKEIVLYAENRGIEIIPEIELPGHSVAAIASYPHLSCTGDSIKVETDWGVFKDIYCAGNDSVFTFLEDVLEEVVELFPSKYIHIGGDEAPKYHWENCSKCQKRIINNNLKDEHELQSYFIKRISDFLKTKNKRLIGWDEIIEGGIPENAIIQSWRGMEGGIVAAKNQNQAIMSPTSHCYFDYDLDAINLEKVYSFEPIPKELSQSESKFIIGGECNMWSERAPQELIDSKVFPRILAMSEVLWSEKEKDYTEFSNRIEKHYPKLDKLGVNYGYEKTPIKFNSTFKENEFIVSIEKGNSKMNLEYNVNNQGWKDYLVPLKFKKNTNLIVKEKNSKRKVVATKNLEFNFHKGLDKKTIYKTNYNPSYQADKEKTLVNGIAGSKHNFRDGQWQGFYGTDIDVVIDLGEKTKFSELSSSYFQYHLSWILLPKSIEYLISNNGETFSRIFYKDQICNPMQEGKFKEQFSYHGEQSARYVRLKAKNYGTLPKQHPAAGSNSWVFIDEFIIQ